MNEPRSTRRRPPIRVRVALWSTGVLLVVLVVGGAAMTSGLRSGLRDRTHESLEVSFRVVVHQLSTQSDLRLPDLLAVASPAGEPSDEVIGQLLDPEGRVQDRSPQPATATPMVGRDVLALARRDGHWHEPRRLPQRTSDDIVVVLPVTSGPLSGDFVVLAQSLAATEAEVARLVRLLLVFSPLVLVTSLLGGLWIARASLRPVDALTRQAAAIDPEVSDAKLPVAPGDDEVTRLGHALNDMLARLRLAIERERRFSADASHELRTPLALMAAELDVSLRSASTPESARPLFESLRDDVARLAAIVDDLLVLSRSDAAGTVALATAEVDLLDLVVTAAARFRRAASARDVSIVVTGAPVPARVDPRLFSQAVANLIDNALKFSGPGDTVRVSVLDGSRPSVTVADEGPGIPTDDVAHVFDRFYRVDHARSRATGGSGLGLAIVRSIVQAHGGTVEVESAVGRGSRFTIRLPAARGRPAP